MEMFSCFILLLYVPSKQLWSWRDGQFTLPHFFPGKLEQAVNQYFLHILSLVTDKQSFLNDSAEEENDSRNYFMINLHESMGRAGIELANPGSAVRLASVARHITDCATPPSHMKL